MPSNQKKPSWMEAALWSVGISVLLNVVYSTCNWYTSTRQGVGSLYFDWELRIPFVEVMIIPYLSINLFFMASFFLCRSREELKGLAMRICTALLIAAACFLAFPLRLAFVRPAGLHGFLGFWTRFLYGVDKLYNCCPSLHIAFWIILGDLFFRRTRGALRIMTMAWFSLVGPSTLLLHQHHIVDVAAGLVLGAGCLKWVPGGEAPPVPSRDRRT